ncbi:MAG: prepilin-type N-terminal cleavage/methylation domain-containing protein [Lachnospiraceae bacterium]|nr:prepilin-type N-terminal cleavage/methylation domain-containing protein [Lachnospiraceae bacterium]
MKIKLRRINNNKGLSLIELIISVAIMSIVFATVMTFLVTGIKMYGNSNTEIRLQESVQLTLSNIENRIIDAQLGVRCDDDGSKVVLTIYNNDSREYIIWDKAAETLSYATSAKDVELADFTGAEVIAKHIDDFNAVAKGTGEDTKVDILVKMNQDDRSLASNKVVSFRNDIVANATSDEVYNGTAHQVSTAVDLAITPSSTYALPGGTCSFKARVSGVGHPSQMVNWSLENAPEGVTIDENGTVRIPTGITADSIKVNAKAVADQNVVGSATILISNITGITLTKEGSKVYAGTMVKVNAQVQGTNLSSEMQKVKFSVPDGQQGVSLYSDSGIFGLNQSVKGKTVTVRATSAANPAIFKDLTFTVENTSIQDVEAKAVTANRNDTTELLTSIVSENLAEAELRISWSIADYGGLDSSKVSVGVANGMLTVAKDINYEKSYTVLVKAAITADRLSTPAEKLIAVTIPAVSVKFISNNVSISKNGSVTIPYEVTGLKAEPSDIYATTNPSIKNSIIYVAEDGIKLSIGNNVKSNKIDVIATFRGTNTSETITVDVK